MGQTGQTERSFAQLKRDVEQGDTMPIDNSARVRFSIQCYDLVRVAYDDPDHPRHTFPEDWDSGAHPRFDFERIQNAFERLIAKGYTVHIDPCGVRIRNKNGEIVFKMEMPSA
jgi:hypothetical protein